MKEQMTHEEMMKLKKDISHEVQNAIYKMLNEYDCVWMDRTPLEGFKINDSTTQEEIDRLALV